MKRTGPTRVSTRRLVSELKREGTRRKEKAWRAISEEIAKPRRLRCEVNLSKIARLAQKFKGKVLVVPGKVLASGSLEEKGVKVAALEFSSSATKKISLAGGSALGIGELLAKKAKASEIVIVK